MALAVVTSPVRATEPEGSAAPAAWAARIIVVLLVLTGVLVRALPIVQGAALLLRQPTEDGYLLLTVARNMAIGLGMSTADGTIPTNGVQPLITFLFAGCFWLAHGDKVLGVGLCMALSLLIALLAMGSVYRLGRVVFREVTGGRTLAAVAAALWFASPVVAAHSMNALETGLYFLCTAEVLRYFLLHAADADRDLGLRGSVTLGVLLGVAFWARNDAIFLGLAVAVTRIGLALGKSLFVLGRRTREVVVVGLTAGILAAPWLINNQVKFGSIVPVSGRSEALDELGGNIRLLPAKLTEYLSVTGAIPSTIEGRLAVQIVCWAVVLGAVVLAAWLFRRGSAVVRAAVVVTLGQAVPVGIYYGIFFGAPHFMSRFVSPLSIMLALFTVPVLVRGVALSRWPRWQWAFPALATLAAMGLDARLYKNQHYHMHFQVVDWVKAHVAPTVWVGAPQTGTLGFFHDRTLNLDGKTNPYALRARLEHRFKEYVLGSQIEYVADWNGMTSWASFLAPAFTLVVNDPEENLAVLHRGGGPITRGP